MSKISKIFSIIFGKENKKGAEESASCRAYKKQILTLETIIDSQDHLIRGYCKEAKQHQEANLMEKGLDAVLQMFAGSKPEAKQIETQSKFNTNPKKQNESPVILDTGEEYSDESIMGFLNKLQPGEVKDIASAPIVFLTKKIRDKVPSISDTSIRRAKFLAQEIINK